jgi:hypothetical protein
MDTPASLNAASAAPVSLRALVAEVVKALMAPVLKWPGIIAKMRSLSRDERDLLQSMVFRGVAAETWPQPYADAHIGLAAVGVMLVTPKTHKGRDTFTVHPYVWLYLTSNQESFLKGYVPAHLREAEAA